MTNIQDIIDFLEQKKCLDTFKSPMSQDLNNKDFDSYCIDWDKLFPKNRPEIDGNNEWDMFGDEWEINPNALGDVFEPITEKQIHESESEAHWDIVAWYQPIHFYGYDWGIRITENGLRQLARRLHHELIHNFGVTAPSGAGLSRYLKALLRTCFALYYRHELYHHKTECFGLRLHVVEQKDCYVQYEQNVYQPYKGTDSQLEEALANAYMYRRFDASRWIPKVMGEALRSHLRRTFAYNPPGYRKAVDYLTDGRFEQGEHQLFSRIQEFTLTTTRSPSEWALAPRIGQSFFNIQSEVWIIVPSGKASVIPVRSVQLKTCSTIEMIKLCQRHGYELVSGGKGSHRKLKKPKSPTIILPDGRDNLSPGVTKNTLKALALEHKLHDLNSIL